MVDQFLIGLVDNDDFLVGFGDRLRTRVIKQIETVLFWSVIQFVDDDIVFFDQVIELARRRVRVLARVFRFDQLLF